jgi:hypothetical protein
MRTIEAVLGAIVLAAATLGTGPRPAGTSLSVSPLVTELRSQPGTPDRIEITIANDGARPERIVITPIDWRTESDGTLAMQRPGANAATSLTAFLSVSDPQFQLAPGARRTVTVTANLPPATKSPSSLWGGFIVKATDAGAAANSMGPASTVLFYDDIGEPRRHLKMEALRLIPGAGGHGTIVARLRNDGDAYARTGAHVTIAQAGRILVDRQIAVGAVFPDRVRLLTEHVTGLRPGRATVSLRLDYGGDVLLDGETTTVVP